MPHATAYEAFTSRKEKRRSEENVGLGGLGEVCGRRVEVESDCEHDDQSYGVGPDVDCLVGEIEDGAYTVDFGLGEAVSFGDVWVNPPGMREIFVTDETMFTGPLDRMLHALSQAFPGASGFLKTFVDHLSRSLKAFFGNAPAFIDNFGKACSFDGVGTSFQLGQESFHYAHTGLSLGLQRLSGRQDVVVAVLESIDKDPGAPSPCSNELAGNMRTRVSHRSEG